MSMENDSKKENDCFYNLPRKVNGTHFLRVDGLKGLMFHFGTLVLSNCCKFCDCWGERDKPGVAGRRLSPAVGVRGSPFGAGARGIPPPFLYIKESYPTITKILYIVGQ